MLSFASRKLRGLVRRIRFGWLRARHALPTITLAELDAAHAAVSEPLLDDVCMPPFAGSPHHEDLFAILRAATALQPHVIVELGTAHGNLTANLCKAVPTARVFTVNAEAEQMTGWATTYALSAAEVGRVYRNAGFADRVTQILCNTLHLDLEAYLDGTAIDLAIIDACHDVEYVLNDFHKIAPHMRAGGLVFLHDTHPSLRDHLRNSYTACMMLRRDGYDVRHLDGTWWAIWRRPGQ